MAQIYNNPCDNTTGQTPIVGTSLPVASGGTYSNSTAGTSRSATILHGGTLSGDGQITWRGYGSGSSGSAEIALLDVNPATGSPLRGYSLRLTDTEIQLRRFDNASTVVTIGSASRTTTGGTNVTTRAEFDSNGGTDYNIRVYEDSTLKFTVNNVTNYNLSTLTRVVAICQLGGSGGNSIDEYWVHDTLDSEAGGPATSLTVNPRHGRIGHLLRR